MNKLSSRIGLISFTLAAAAAVQAYDFVNLKAPNTGTQMNIIQQGAFSLGVNGSFSSTSLSGGGGSFTSSQLSLGGGYFVTNEIQLFGELTYMSSSLGGTTSSTLVLVGGRYYFAVAQDKQTLPFVGVFGGFGQNTGSGSSSSNVTAYGAEVGLQYFVAPSVSFSPVVTYTSYHLSGATANQFGLELGLTVWFK